VWRGFNHLYGSFVTENHILEDVNKCVLALQEGDFDTLDRTAGAIRGRSSRVCNVVGAEMDNYEPGIYTERVLEAVKVLRDQGKHADILGCVDPEDGGSRLLWKLVDVYQLGMVT